MITKGSGDASAGEAGCGRKAFGIKKEGTYQSAIDKRYFRPPEEIAAISRGVYREFVGLFINDGIARWIGADVDRGELVEVDVCAGPRVGNAPKIGTPTKELYQREEKDDKVHRIETVRRRPLTEEELCDLIRVANDVWSRKPIPRIPSFSVTDVHDMLYLLDGKEMKTYGPAGDLEDAKELCDLLHQFRKRTWGE